MGPRQEETGAPRRDRVLDEPWLLGACACVVAAAASLVLGFYDAAFVVAALGAVAWFLNVRSKLPRPPDDTEADEQTHEGADDDRLSEAGGADEGERP